MTELQENFSGWYEIYKYLARDYFQRESKYLHGSKVNKPDVIVPSESVPNPRQISEFSPTNRSFDLSAEYNLRHDSIGCSIQIRIYEDGEHLYRSVDEDNNIFLGTDIPRDIQSYQDQLYYVQLNWKNPERTSLDDIERSVRALIGHLFLDILAYNPGGWFKQKCPRDIRL